MDNYTAVGIAEGFVDAESDEQIIEAWQHLVDTGLAWTLQGWFGRHAQAMIDAGQIQPANNPNGALKAVVSGAVQSGKAQAITEVRPLSSIAAEIRADWSRIGKGINYAAKPYLDAMGELNSIRDDYYADTGASVVAYFLSNATSYRGETAKRLKAELKAQLKSVGY